MSSSIIKKYNGLPLGMKASIWFMVCSFFQKGVTTLTTPIFTRLLSTTDYGQFSLYNSWLSILVVIVSLKLAGGVYQQALVKFDNMRETLTSSLQGLTTALVLIAVLIYLPFHHFWNSLFSLDTVLMVAMFFSVFGSSVFDLWAYRQRVDYKYKALLIITVVTGTLKPVLGVLAIKYLPGRPIDLLVIASVSVEFVTYFSLYIAQFKRNSHFFDAFFWKYSLRFNIPLIPHYLSQSVLNQADRIMIAQMCGAKYAGIYSVAYSISVIMNLFNNAVRDALNPFLYKCIKKKQYDALNRVSMMVLIFVAIVDLLVILVAPELIRFFAPPEYYSAVWIIAPVSMSIFFTFTYCLFVAFEFYFEKTSLTMVSSLLSAVLNIGLNFLAIPRFGFIAAGYTTLLSYMAYCLFHFFAMRFVENKYMGGTHVYRSSHILIISLIFVILGFLMMLIYDSLILRLIAFAILIIIALILGRRAFKSIK